MTQKEQKQLTDDGGGPKKEQKFREKRSRDASNDVHTKSNARWSET